MIILYRIQNCKHVKMVDYLVLCRRPEFMDEYFAVLRKHGLGLAQKTTN